MVPSSAERGMEKRREEEKGRRELRRKQERQKGKIENPREWCELFPGKG